MSNTSEKNSQAVLSTAAMTDQQIQAMRRQHEFTSNAILLLNRRLSENADFAGRLLAALRNTAATNISQQQLLR